MRAGATSRRRLLAAAAAAVGSITTDAWAQSSAVAPQLPLTAQTTEGPYYLDGMPPRSDITEGLPGLPLEVRLSVRTREGAPLPGCRVDVWQCDAQGLYSGFAGQGEARSADLSGRTFLRGNQVADAQGEVRFQTIYPGWYEGRTTHVHFKVFHQGRAVLTSQFFLPDALNEYLYEQVRSYRRDRPRGVLNRTDGIAMMAGDTALGSVREDANRYIALLDVVVDPQAQPRVHRPGPGAGPPPGATGRGGPPPGFGGVPALPVPQGEARIRALMPPTRN